MFKDEESIAFRKMHEFSTADGFVEISENIADMIKFVANEPSVGLFYVQQHTQKAVPNLINLKNNVRDKSHETALHTEDLEDSITMIGSMKECGFPIADDMIRDIKNSLSIISTKQPKRGLLNSSSSRFLGNTTSWSPSTWGRNTIYPPEDVEKSSGYLTGVFKSAKQRAGSFKWAQVESTGPSQSKGENLLHDISPALPDAVDTPSSTMKEAAAEAEDLVLSSNEVQEDSQLGKSLSHERLLSFYENYDVFKADKEAKFEEWLGGTGNEENRGGEKSGTNRENLGR
ncbi:hypothetical protein ACJIZ3_022881 [Penstemon smallii]|uniref:Uncharacterized protein n=1 Tax=Penstemon smallii TaxID=265156 RepID=A0ABD3TNI6_9LAMI